MRTSLRFEYVSSFLVDDLFQLLLPYAAMLRI